MGASTSKSATDALEAQTALARQGFKTNEILAATPETLALAIAGNLELETAAKLVASTLKSYRLEVGDTGKVVDDFATIASSSAFTVEELGPAFRQVAPLAAEFNVPFEKLLAVMGELRSGGLIPEQVGTALRNVIAILNEEPTTAVLDVFAKLGIDFHTMREEFKKTGDITGVFRTLKTAGLDGQKALELFGREAVTAATIITERAPQIEELEKALRNNEGAAKDMQKVMEKGLPGAVAQLKSAFEGMILALGDAGVTGFLERAADKMTALVARFQELSPEVKAMVAVVITAGPALLFISAAAKGASFALGGLLPVVNGMRFCNGLTGWHTVRIGGLTTGLAGILPVLAPILPAIIAVVALAAIFVAAWKPISTFFAGLWGGLSDDAGRVSEAWTRLMDELGPVGDGIKAIFGLVGEAWSALFPCSILMQRRPDGGGRRQSSMESLL